MELARTFDEARSLARGLVGCVPTMGYLHEGHLSHVKAARAACDTVVVTLFVNPLQFGESEDLDRYPRDLDRDSELVEKFGADVLFAPSLEEMFAVEPAARVVVQGLSDRMEGAHRPGHFSGVATVVAKLFAGLRPHRAYFGRKDAQQLAVVRRMAADLSFPVDVVGGPIVREQDGLALSSRNIYLSDGDRKLALGLSLALLAAEQMVLAGERDATTLEQAVHDDATRSGLDLEYVELAGRADVERLEKLDQDSFLAAAAQVGSTRLIDNLQIFVSPVGTPRPEFGVMLEEPSLLYDRRG